LLVVHEETLRILVGHLRGLNDNAMQALNFRNCEVTRATLRSSR
jgi:broad specificity phosphatase PhoE